MEHRQVTITQPKKLVLITGGTGFIGNHVIAEFLGHGYRVRATVRNQAGCDRLLQTHARSADNLETHIVPDITALGAFDEAVKGVDGVVHMASPFMYKIKNNERDLILPAIQGTRGILQSITTFGSQVDRVILTSSFAVIADFSQGLRPGHVYDESQWNPMSYQAAKDDKIGLAYAGSKALAEATAWQLVNETPGIKFSLATINPVMVYGPPFPRSGHLGELGESLSEIYKLMNGSTAIIPPTKMPVYADVRDVAKAHYLAYDGKHQGRFLISAGHFTNQDVARLLQSHNPKLKNRVPVESQGGQPDPAEHYIADSSRARGVLNLSFRSFPETFLHMSYALLEMEEEVGSCTPI